MHEQSFQPVHIDSEQAVAKARNRPGFSQAWDALEEKYAAHWKPC